MALCSGPASGQSATAPTPPRYPLPTYEEDWRYLAHGGQSDDPWNLIKFVPLAGDGASSFLSLGGEARVTYERFGNQDFGLTIPSPEGYLLQRYLFHADVHASPRIRVWTEVNSSFETGRVGGPRPVLDKNALDLHQAFVDALLYSAGRNSVSIRAGRQEIAIGSGRMYSLREGPNVPLGFDAVRLTLHRANWRFDGWAARPVLNRNGVFDDGSHRQYEVRGAYASRPPAKIADVGIDLYYLGIDRIHARFDQGIGDETRHTLGARVWRVVGEWGYDTEAMYQFGRFGAGDIRAWRGIANGWRTWPTVGWRPRIEGVVDIASGDKNRSDADLQTFNSLFQSGTYSGRAQLLGPYNSIRLEPSIVVSPWPTVAVSGGWGFYWRQDLHDGLYGISGNLIVPSNGAPGRFEGSRPTVQVDWQVSRHLSAHVNYIYVFNGHFEETSVHGTSTMSFISPWISYRF
ncbi:MAG TPA: alginate export family protein [Vicinamibacterales bacterium]|nr:alginate export family protein [Vicinamibacterales bacterium]